MDTRIDEAWDVYLKLSSSSSSVGSTSAAAGCTALSAWRPKRKPPFSKVWCSHGSLPSLAALAGGMKAGTHFNKRTVQLPGAWSPWLISLISTTAAPRGGCVVSKAGFDASV